MAIFNKIPWTNFHELNLDWIIKHLKLIEQKVDQIVSDHDAVVALQSDMTNVKNRMTAAESDIAGLESDMVTAQSDISSIKTRVTTIETKLAKIPLPSASDVGKVLGAVADGAGAKLEYVAQTGGSVPTPAAGDSGKVLKAGSGGTYSWQNETACPVPTPGSGDSGKVLTAGSGGSMSWQTAPSGGSGTVLRDSHNSYEQVFLDDNDYATPTTYPVLTEIAADMAAARAISADAVHQVYNRVRIIVNGRTLPPDSLGWSLGGYTTSTERFYYMATAEATTAKVSGTFKRVRYTGQRFALYLPISGTPVLEYTAPTGFDDLSGGSATSVAGVTTLTDRMAERMIVEIGYNRAS